MDNLKFQQYEKLGPFEIKDFLQKVASKAAVESSISYLNAGRGNPNWIATEPREAFFLLGQFAVTESKRVRELRPGVGGMAKAAGVAAWLGSWLSKDDDMPGAQWEFVVFESKEANAFCLPGGRVGVYTGILPVTKDESGLAPVIGHEVAHAVARHGGERMSEAMVLQTGGSLLGATLSNSDPRMQAAAMATYGVTSQVGVALPHSRAQESEADHIGLIYMAEAGYDPQLAVAFWQRFADFAKQQGDNTPTFLRTHPTDATRIKQLQVWMPEALAKYHPVQ